MPVRTAYLASSFALADRVAHVRDVLSNLGVAVPDVWWERSWNRNDMAEAEWYAKPEVRAIAQRHWKSIDEADVFIFVAGDEPRRFTGANVELGYAIARGVPCYVYGCLKRSAMYGSVTFCPDDGALVGAMSTLFPGGSDYRDIVNAGRTDGGLLGGDLKLPKLDLSDVDGVVHGRGGDA